MSGHRVGLSPVQREAWLAYLRGSQLLDRAIDHQLRVDAELSHAEFEILVRLSETPGRRLRMGELAVRAVAPKTRLTYQIERLEKRGLVARERTHGDHRGIDAVLTERGMQILRDVAPGHLDAVRGYLVDVLSDDELRALGKIMARLAAAAERSS